MTQFQVLNPLGALAGVQGAVSQGQTIRQQRQQNRLSELMEPYKMQQAQMQQERMRMSNQQLQGAISDEDRVRLGRDAQLYVELFGPDLPETLEEADARHKMAVQGMGRAGANIEGMPEGFDPNFFDQTTAFAAESQRMSGGGSKYQFGASEVVRTDDGLMLVTQRRDPRTGKVETVSSPVDGAFVNKMGQTAEEQVGQKAREAAATKGAEAEVEIQAAQTKAYQDILGREGGQVYADLQRAAQSASQFLPKLERLREMAAAANTGAYAQAKMMGKKYLGLDVSSDEAFNAELMGLAQDILNQQTGTKTDFDFRVAVEQSASMGKTPEANVMLINALIQRQQDAVRFGDLAREAMQRGGAQAVLDLRFTPETQGGGMSEQERAELEALRRTQR